MGFGNFLRAQLSRKFLPIASFGMAPAVREKKDDSSPGSSQGSDEGDERRMRTVNNIKYDIPL